MLNHLDMRNQSKQPVGLVWTSIRNLLLVSVWSMLIGLIRLSRLEQELATNILMGFIILPMNTVVAQVVRIMIAVTMFEIW